MNLRFEERDTFRVCGYAVEANLDNNDKVLGELWLKHEDKLRKMPEGNSCLYGVTWYTDETHKQYYYLLGIESFGQGDLDDMNCVEIPKAYFAVMKIPKGMSAVDAWTDFFYKEIPASGYIPDEKHGIYFEFYDENGNCELWTPVKLKTKDNYE